MTDTKKSVKAPETLEQALLTINELNAENAKQSEVINQQNALIKEQAEELAKAEKKLARVAPKPSVTVKKVSYTVNCGAQWDGVEYTPEELADNPEVCEEILKASPKTSIFTKED